MAGPVRKQERALARRRRLRRLGDAMLRVESAIIVAVTAVLVTLTLAFPERPLPRGATPLWLAIGLGGLAIFVAFAMREEDVEVAAWRRQLIRRYRTDVQHDAALAGLWTGLLDGLATLYAHVHRGDSQAVSGPLAGIASDVESLLQRARRVVQWLDRRAGPLRKLRAQRDGA